jgi:hypothetical protein
MKPKSDLAASSLLFLLTLPTAVSTQFNYGVYHGSFGLLPDFTPSLR